MTEDRFKPGDSVRHKSGGPKMIVVEYGDYTEGRRVHCRWFEEGTKVTEAYFIDAELEAHQAAGARF
jgi:uncharacterized protein YodC (DUF2158 family)